MPTRFPAGLNAYKPKNPLSYLPTNAPNLSGWSIWADDFERYAGWTLLADSTGTGGLASTNATDTVYGHGTLSSTTANTDADKNTFFPTPQTANTLASLWGYNSSPEWIFGCAFGLVTDTAQGIAIGGATGSSVNSAGTAGNMTTLAAANGIYVRKAVGASDIELVWYRSSTLQAQIQCVAAASVAIATRYKITARQYKGTLTVWVNDVQVGVDTSFTNSPSTGSSVAPFIQTVQSGTGGAQQAFIDYTLFATRTKNGSTLPNGRV